MNTNLERSLSNNWTGSAMANPLSGDWEPLWQENNVILSGSDKILDDPEATAEVIVMMATHN